MFRDADAAANARIAAANKMLYVSGRFLPDHKLRDDPNGDLARQAYFSCVQPAQPTPQPQQPQLRTLSAMERLQQQMRMGMAGRPGAQPSSSAAARGRAPLSLGSPDSAARRRRPAAVAPTFRFRRTRRLRRCARPVWHRRARRGSSTW